MAEEGEDASTWSVEQVGVWLGKLKGVDEDTVAEFAKNDIDGETLLDLSKDELKDDLGGEPLALPASLNT